MREFTQQEQQAILAAEQQLKAKGLIVEEGDADATYNGERILAFFDLNVNTPVTVQTILSACEQMRNQLRWKSGAQQKYDTVYNQLTKVQQDQFGSFWFSQKNVLVLDGDEGYENAAKIISWMRGKTFDARTLSLAVSNLTATIGLHLARTPSTFKGGKHSGSSASFMSRSETNLSARDHAARRAAEAAAAEGNKPAPATDYKALAESITTGRTHSDSLRIQKFYVTKPNSEIDWEQTYYQRRRIADGKGR